MSPLNDLEFIKQKRSEASTLVTAIKSKRRELEKTIVNLDETVDKANDLINNFDIKEILVNKKTGVINKFYDETFLPLKSQINDKSTGLKKTIDRSTNLRKIINTKRNDLIKAQRDIQKSLTSYESHLDDLRRTEKALKNVSRLSEIDRKKIEESRNSIYNKRIEIEKMLADVKEILETTKGYSENTNKSMNDNLNILKTLKNEAIETNSKINKLYEIASNKTIAGAFDNHRKKLEKKLTGWEVRLTITTLIALLIAGFLIYYQLEIRNGVNSELTLTDIKSDKSFDYNFYLRFFVVTPVVYYLIFCVAQFKKTQESLEKYVYKTVVALSIEAHAELLSKNFPEHEKETYEFSMNSLKKVYNEPYISEREESVNNLNKETVDIKKELTELTNKVTEVINKFTPKT